MGTPDFAVAGLKELVENGYRVVGVVTAPDRPAGRGRKLTPSAVKEYATARNLPILQPERLRDPRFLSDLNAWKPDIQVVVAFRMLPRAVWSLPSIGTFNLHASLLPQYRGAAPINWAIINGETTTGLTTFMIDEEIDTGAILMQTRTPIHEEDDAGMLHDRLMNLGAALIVKTVDGLWEGTLSPMPQETSDNEELRPAPKIFREDCRIDWARPAQQLFDFIRGLSPHPGAWSVLKAGIEETHIKFFRVKYLKREHTLEPGSLFSRDDEFWIACSDGYIIPFNLQLSGRKRLEVRELLKGWEAPENGRFE